MEKLQAPSGCGQCSVEGVEYTPDENGLVDVAFEHVASLLCHGFTVAVVRKELTAEEVAAHEVAEAEAKEKAEKEKQAQAQAAAEVPTQDAPATPEPAAESEAAPVAETPAAAVSTKKAAK
jgi:predicted  nucleic acid-binding Zn-ribbon protein